MDGVAYFFFFIGKSNVDVQSFIALSLLKDSPD